MTEKEATIFIIDVGQSMGKKSNGRLESNLEWAMKYVWDKITTAVATGRKTLAQGVICIRSDATNNEFSVEKGFENLSVIQRLGQILLSDLRNLRAHIKVSNTSSGDAISAIALAIHNIEVFCKKLKYRRQIVLITDGEGPLDTDDKEDIIQKLEQENIQLTVLGVDFDDADFGFKEEDKSYIKGINEAFLKSFTEQCGGIYGTLQEAISELEKPRIKATRPIPSYRGTLSLGNPHMSDSHALSIDVERYPRTYLARAPGASNFVYRSDLTNAEGSTQSAATIGPGDGEATANLSGGNNLTSVKSMRTYQVDDEDAANGKRDVDRDDLAKGYEYGRTAVHISESDENVTKLETTSGLELIGFIPQAKFERYMDMSVSNIIIAQKANELAGMALSSFVHALEELETYGIARLVTKDDKAPVMVLLAPSLEQDYESLIEVQLPFAEDVRPYKFAPLDRVFTVSGKALKEHRNLPNTDLRKAMDELVDCMDLSTLGMDDEGQPMEYMPMDETYSAVIHRINHAIKWRASHPSEPISEPYPVLTKFSNPPAALMVKASPILERLAAVADVKKVPPKAKGRRYRRDDTKPLSGLNVDELLGREDRTRISPGNAIPEFKQMLSTTDNPEGISDAANQMSGIIRSQIKNSFGTNGYGQALEAVGVLRAELIAYEEPELYNDFIKKIRDDILENQLGGDRRELWWEIRKHALGLVDHQQSEASSVSEDEAKAFLSSR